MLPTVTRRFIDGIIRSGRLTEARQRCEKGEAASSAGNFGSSSCWSLVCEEVIDTDHEPAVYDAVYAELIRRGFQPDEIDAMRRLAWKTAGWMNYDMMLWDWVGLDEGDMRRALEWQLEKRKIGKDEYEIGLATIQQGLDQDSAARRAGEREGDPA